MKINRLLCLILGAIFLSNILPVFCAGEETSDSAKESKYHISVNDLLEISVYEEPDLTKTVRVSSDGTISSPLLGNIFVKGLTAKDLEKKITELLERDYLVNPQVSVFIKEYARVSILGQVSRPGAYELKSGLTVMDAIAMAGGFTDKANAEDVKLVRIKGTEKETISLNANEIVRKGKKEKDIELEPGDLIIVGELTEQSTSVVVLGQVRRPGKYNLTKGMTVIEVIALAGGLSETAAANGTKIIRIEDGKKTTIAIPLGSILKGGERDQDITLRSGDTVVVPESFF